MLIVLPPDKFHFKSFVNLNCVETCNVGEEYVQEYGDTSYKPFFLMLGETMIGFDTLADAEKVFDDIVAAYARGDKVFHIVQE